MINPKWSRWVISSIFKHFQDGLSDIHIHFEGSPRQTEDKDRWVEVRVDGPDYYQDSRIRYRGHVEVNIGIVVVESASNMYDIHEIAGQIESLFKSRINAYKYGDDNSYLGCLLLDKGAGEGYNIRKYYFGRVNAQTPMYQAAVEAPYFIYLETD